MSLHPLRSELVSPAGSAHEAARHIRLTSDHEATASRQSLSSSPAPTRPRAATHPVQIRSPAPDSAVKRGRPEVLGKVRRISSASVSTTDDSSVDSCGAQSSSEASSKLVTDESDSGSDEDMEPSMLQLHSSRMACFRRSRMDIERHRRQLPAFFTEKIEGWFQFIDANGDGVLTQLELRVALQNNQELQAVLCVGLGIDSETSASCGRGRSLISNQSTEVRTEVFRENRRRANRIIEELDWGKERRLDAVAFVDFFRKRGMLLE